MKVIGPQAIKRIYGPEKEKKRKCQFVVYRWMFVVLKKKEILDFILEVNFFFVRWKYFFDFFVLLQQQQQQQQQNSHSTVWEMRRAAHSNTFSLHLFEQKKGLSVHMSVLHFTKSRWASHFLKLVHFFFACCCEESFLNNNKIWMKLCVEIFFFPTWSLTFSANYVDR